jgi:hypothetical protein
MFALAVVFHYVFINHLCRGHGRRFALNLKSNKETLALVDLIVSAHRLVAGNGWSLAGGCD